MTINLICAVFLICSCIAVWRIPWILMSLGNVDDSEDFREICFMQFLCSILDYLTIIPALIAFLSPTRIYHLIKKIHKKLNRTGHYDGKDYLYTFSIRWACWENCGIGIVDTICLIFGLMSAVIPTRTIAFFRIILYFWSDYFNDNYNEMRFAWFRNGALGVFDIFILPHCVAIVFPTRTYSLIHDIYYIGFKDTRAPNFAFEEDYLHYNVDYRWAILKSFWIGFVDLFNIPLFIVCILSVYNGVELIHLMKDYRYRWNNRIRLKILINFAVVIFDVIFVLPLLLVIIGTIYRIPSVYKHIHNSWSIYYKIRNNELTPNEANDDDNKPLNTRIHILCNFLLILYDILFTLISLIMIFVTWYRTPILFKEIIFGTGQDNDNSWNPFVTEDETTVIDKYEEHIDALLKRLLICQQALFILLDIPCFILSIIVYVTLWRTKILHKALWNDIPQQIEKNREHNQQHPNQRSVGFKPKETGLAKLRRITVLYQFGFLLRDIVFMVLFCIIAGTLYRLPFVVLALMSKLRTPNIEDDEQLDIEEATLNIPEKGKITINVKGKKAASLAFKDKSVNCRLYVLGTAFWNAVGDTFGATVQTAGQSQLPNKWGHNKGFDYDLVRENETDFDIECTLQTPELKRKVIHKNIKKLDGKVSMVLQLEADDKDIGILTIFILTVDDLVLASMMDGTGTLILQKGVHFNCDKKNIETLRGSDFPSMMDAFWIIVAEQFFYLMKDIFHLVLFFLVLIAPWRFVKCCLLIFRDKSYWYLQEHDRAMGMLEHSYFIYRQFYYHYFQPMMNDMVKDEYEYHQRSGTMYGLDSLHINYSHYFDKFRGKLNKYWNRTYKYMEQSNEDNPNKFNMSLTTYDEIVEAIDKKLSKIKPVPASKNLCRDYFEMQNIRLYLKIMHSTINLFLMNKKISTQHHAILSEQLNVENFKYEEDMERYHALIHNSHKDLQKEFKEKSKEKLFKKLFSKDVSTMQKMIRFCFMKACQDIIAFILIILIICTIYRTVPFIRDLYHVIQLKIDYFRMRKNKDKAVGPSLRFGLKKVIQKHVKGFAWDIINLLQLLFFTLLIIITLVRLTEYLLKLIDGGRERGETHFSLEIAVEIAKEELREVRDDLWEIFALVFAWKFYKFGMASAVFGVLLPSTAFLEIYAFICGCCPRKLRLYLAIFTWFGLLSVIIYYLAHMGHDNVDTKVFITLSFCVLLFTFLFYLLLFGCYKRKSYDIHDEDEAFYRNKVSEKKTKHVVDVYNKLCVKCDNTLLKDTMNNIEEYYRVQNDIYGKYTYYWWWYNRRCEFCKDYLYGYNIGYHCKPCNIVICNWCSRHCKQDKSSRSELQKGWIPGGFNAAHVKQKMDDIGIILWSYPNDGYVPLHVRFTWPNVFAYLTILWEILQLLSVFVFVIYIETWFPGTLDSDLIPNINDIDDNVLKVIVQSSKWLLLSHKNTNESLYEAINYILLILGIFWMIICSLPLVCEQLFNFVDKRGTFTQSSMWIKCAWFYTRILYVFLIINWIRLFQCIPTQDNQCLLVAAPAIDSKKVLIGYLDEESQVPIYASFSAHYSGKGVLAFIIIIFYWLTAGITVVYNNAQTVLQRNFHFDIVYPIVFVHVLQLMQSLFILSGMLLILYDVDGALLFCLILSYLMLLWHIMYGFLCKQMLINTDNKDLIFSFSSIPNIMVLRIFLYIMFAYNTTVLYLYLTRTNTMNNVGLIMLIGSLIIVCNGIIIAFVYHRLILKRRRQKLSKSEELKGCLELLISLYNKTDENGIIGDWHKDGASKLLSQIIEENDPTKNIKTSTSKLFSVSDVAGIIIEFERHILFERLTESFLNKRKQWIQSLLECDEFNDIIPLILDLVNAIQIPPFFTVGFNILCNDTLFRIAPLVICSLVMQFIEDHDNVADLCKIHLTDINKIPSTVFTLDKWGKYFSIKQSIDRFGNDIATTLKTFVNKTMLWHSNKDKRLYASHLCRTGSSYATSLYRSQVHVGYYVLLPQYIIWFNKKKNIESLETVPDDYIDLSSLDYVTKRGITMIEANQNRNIEDEEEKYDDEIKDNTLYTFECKHSDDERYSWYRYYWWYYNRKSYFFGGLNESICDKWIKNIEKVLNDRKEETKQIASKWAKDVEDKIKDKRGFNVHFDDPWKKSDDKEQIVDEAVDFENPWDKDDKKENKKDFTQDWAKFDENDGNDKGEDVNDNDWANFED